MSTKQEQQFHCQNTRMSSSISAIYIWFLWHLNLLDWWSVCTSVNPSGTEARIFQEKWVNTIAADALAPCVTRESAAIWYKLCRIKIFGFHKEEFKLGALSQWWEMMKNINTFLCFCQKNSARQGLTLPYNLLHSALTKLHTVWPILNVKVDKKNSILWFTHEASFTC